MQGGSGLIMLGVAPDAQLALRAVQNPSRLVGQQLAQEGAHQHAVVVLVGWGAGAAREAGWR